MKRSGTIAAIFFGLMAGSAVPTQNPWVSPHGRLQDNALECPDELPAADSLLDDATIYTAPDAVVQVSCVLEQLYESPAGQNNILSVKDYLLQQGITADQWETLRPFLPQDVLTVNATYQDLMPFMAGIIYLSDIQSDNIESREDWQNSTRRMLEGRVAALRGSIHENYSSLLYSDFRQGAAGGISILPARGQRVTAFDYLPFHQAARQTAEYQNDMRLLMAFHELCHYGGGEASGQLTRTDIPNHAEAAADICALSIMAHLRGGITPAMRDYVAWRKFDNMNFALSAGMVPITHAAGRIVEAYMADLEARGDYSERILEKAFATDQLLATPTARRPVYTAASSTKCADGHPER